MKEVEEKVSNMEFNIDNIRALMAGVDQHGLSGLEIKTKEFEIKIEGRAAVQTAVLQSASAAMQAAQPSVQASDTDTTAFQGSVVKSPIVGTFYSAAGPDKEPFVKIGQQVHKGDTLFIIESMKLMNEVASEYDGVVTEILCKNGDGVEYGQPILCIE